MKSKIKFAQVTTLLLFLLILCSLYFLAPHKCDLFISNNGILDVKINENNKTLSLTQNTQIEDVHNILNNYTYKQRLLKKIDHSNKMNLAFDLDNFQTCTLEIYADNILFYNGKRYKIVNDNKTNLYTELNTYALSLIKTSSKK